MRQPAAGKVDTEAAGKSSTTWLDWVAQPRSLVFATLLLAAGAGGGSRLWRGWQARRVVNRLAEADVTPGEVVAAARFGRAVLPGLYPLLDPATPTEVRVAAAEALGALWRRDELVAEEEKGVATRVHEVVWRSRRRYPRTMTRPIPVEVTLRLLGLEVPGLDWSCRIRGARRASLETASAWMSIASSPVRFEVIPGDFAGREPHELVIEPRLRFGGGTGWEVDLPHSRQTLEFDPLLEIDALKALSDEGRGEQIARALTPVEAEDEHFVALDEGLAVRGPLGLKVVGSALPCQLAHRVFAEFEGVGGRYRLGELVTPAKDGVFEFDAIEPEAGARLSEPMATRLRYHLVPDAELGWCAPEVRSLWPGEVVTDWRPVEVVRR